MFATPSPLPFRLNGSVIAERADGQVLIVKKPRPRHAWQFPQGGAEPGDADFAATALREFREELGTDKICILGGERGVFRYYFPTNMELVRGYNDRYAGQEVHLFYAEFLGTDADIVLDKNELIDWAWVSPAQTAILFEDPDYRRITAEILQNRHA